MVLMWFVVTSTQYCYTPMLQQKFAIQRKMETINRKTMNTDFCDYKLVVILYCYSELL